MFVFLNWLDFMLSSLKTFRFKNAENNLIVIGIDNYRTVEIWHIYKFVLIASIFVPLLAQTVRLQKITKSSKIVPCRVSPQFKINIFCNFIGDRESHPQISPLGLTNQFQWNIIKNGT